MHPGVLRPGHSYAVMLSVPTRVTSGFTVIWLTCERARPSAKAIAKAAHVTIDRDCLGPNILPPSAYRVPAREARGRRDSDATMWGDGVKLTVASPRGCQVVRARSGRAGVHHLVEEVLVGALL